MSESKYTRIRLNSLPAGTAIPFDLYVAVGDRHIHYLRAGDQLAPEKMQSMEQKAPEAFYVLSVEIQKYKDFIKGQIDSDQLTIQEKAIILRESSMALVEELYESPDIEKALHESRKIIETFVEFMDTDPSAMAHLVGLSSHDFYTYNHSLDVSIYNLGLGQAVGFEKEDLKELGLGGLYHDIGKRNVALEIICKNGPLDDVEWAQMQKHPQFGLMLLDEHSASDNIKACCFEHHESFLGNGYPQQLSGPEIHPMARITAIADTYDALTTKRSYNQPMRPLDALEMMKEKLANRYDPDLLNAMYSILFRLPGEKVAI